MKTIYNIFLACAAITMLVACNDELDSELYKQQVAFGKNGVNSVYVRYEPGGITSYDIPIVVGGTTFNSKEYHVKLALDKDTLDRLNFERFRNREDLWFEELDSRFYKMPDEVVIPKGSAKGLLTIDFSLDGIDLVNNYILPLTIVEDPSYEVNLRKHYRKSLLQVIPFNDYSGTYSAVDVVISDRTGIQKEPITMDNRVVSVVDDKTVFFYAGTVEEEDRDRDKYKVMAEFQPSEGSPHEGLLKLSCPNADEINFKANAGSFTIVKQMDAQLPYLEHEFITMQVDYEYDHIKSGGIHLQYKCEGSMILERKRNLLIPDEDQQIQW